MPFQNRQCRVSSRLTSTTSMNTHFSDDEDSAASPPCSPPMMHEPLTRATPPLTPTCPTSFSASRTSSCEMASFPVYCEELFDSNIIHEAVRQWSRGPHNRDEREAHYITWLLGHIRGKGFKFLRNFSLQVTKQTLESLMHMISPDITNPNLVLARLLVLYNRVGLFIRSTNSLNPKNSEEEWLPFPHHPACMLAHGKRVILTGVYIDEIMAWLKKGQKPFSRFSSHKIRYFHHSEDWQETKSALNAIGKNDFGINIGLFGIGNRYPFPCINKVSSKSYLYQSEIVKPGRFGHILLGPVVKQKNGEETTFIGLENNGPGLTSPQGYGHGIACKENNLSAFWLLKWGDKKLIDALTYYAETQDVPNEASCLPGKNYGKIKTVIDFVRATQILALTDGDVLAECKKILSNPLHLSPVRKMFESDLRVIPRTAWSERAD